MNDDSLNDADGPLSLVCGILQDSKISVTLEKEFKCSFKNFKSIVEKSIQARLCMKSELTSFQKNDTKYLDFQVILRPSHIQPQEKLFYLAKVSNIDNNVTELKVEGGVENLEQHVSPELLKDKLQQRSITAFRFPTVSQYDKLLDSDGALNLTFKVTLKLDNKTKTDESATLTENYKEMLINAEHYFTDAVFHCHNGIIRAHKNVLAARSEYFQNMFLSNMKEGLSGEIEVKHMEVSVCQTILEYIYTGKVDPGKMNVEVLAEAEKMRLMSLKKECSDKLIKDLAANNCVKMIEAADLHKDQDLKNKAKQFIIENYQDLTNDSKDELFHYPDIAREVFECVHKDLPIAKRMRVN